MPKYLQTFKFDLHFYALLILLRASAFWIGWALFHHDLPWSVALMYREGGQDIEYYSYMASVAKTGFFDAADYLVHGARVVSFPFGSVALHSLFYNLFGIFGVFLADATIAIAVFLLLTQLFKRFEIKPLIASTMALFVVVGLNGKVNGVSRVVNGILGDKANWIAMIGFIAFALTSIFYILKKRISWIWVAASGFVVLGSVAYSNWEYFTWRFPRPFVTEVYFLSFLVTLLKMSDEKDIFKNKINWLMLGVVASLLMQSEIYEFFFCGLLLSFLTAMRLVAGFRLIDAFKSLASFLGPFLLVSAPFFFQRLHETPDVPKRYGLYEVSRFQVFIREITSNDLYFFTLLAVVGMIVFSRFEKIESQRRKWALITAVFFAFFSMPLFTFFTGKVIEPGHFNTMLVFTSTLVGLVLIGLLATHATEQKSAFINRIGKLRILFAVVLLAGGNILKDSHKALQFTQHTRIDFPEYQSIPNYRQSFSDLVKFLDSPEFPNSLSIATYDIQVLHWWGAYHRGKYFLPAQFASPLKDHEIEDRLITVNRLLGLNPDEFIAVLNNRMVNLFFFTCLKYQFHKGHSFSRWDDYLPEDQAMYWATDQDSFNTAIPISERNRLKQKFTDAALAGHANLPDVIVLLSNPLFDSKSPPASEYKLVYEKGGYRVFKKLE